MHSVFVNADELDEFIIKQDALLHGNSPRLGVSFGIVNGDFDLQIPEIWPMESLGDFRRIGQRVADDIQPTLVDETARLNHESIAFPSSDRVSIPPRLGVGAGQGPAVHEYLAKSVICFIHDDDQLRSLDDL